MLDDIGKIYLVRAFIASADAAAAAATVAAPFENIAARRRFLWLFYQTTTTALVLAWFLASKSESHGESTVFLSFFFVGICRQM